MVVGGTFAWFTDAELAGEAVFQAGTVEIQACLKRKTDQDGHIDGNWNPGDCSQVKYEIKNTGSKQVRVRVQLTGQWYDEQGNPWTPPEGVPADVVKVSLCEDSRCPCSYWIDSKDGYLYYTQVLDSKAKATLSIHVCLDGPKTVNAYQGKTYVLKGSLEAVQASNHAPFHEWQVDLFGRP